MKSQARRASESPFATLLHVVRHMLLAMLVAALIAALLMILFVLSLALLPTWMMGSAVLLESVLLLSGTVLFFIRRDEVKRTASKPADEE